MKVFNSIGHFFSWTLSVLPTATKDVQAVEAAVAGPLASAVASLAGKTGLSAQAQIEAIAGDVLSAFANAGEAIGAGGLNVSFDLATITAIKTLFNDLKGEFKGKTVPVAAVVPGK